MVKQAGWQGYFNIGRKEPTQSGHNFMGLGAGKHGWEHPTSIWKIILRSMHRSKAVLKLSDSCMSIADIENKDRRLQES